MNAKDMKAALHDRMSAIETSLREHAARLANPHFPQLAEHRDFRARCAAALQHDLEAMVAARDELAHRLQQLRAEPAGQTAS